MLIGGVGSDIYWWGKGEGKDQVTSAADNGQDALYLYNVSRSEYNAWNSNGSLHFSLADGSTMDLNGWYNTAATNRIQSLIYSDNIAYAWNNGSGATVNLYNYIYETNGIRHVKSLDEGNCILRGGSGNDTIEGGSGADQLWGGTGGDDTLIGGAGADTYWFSRSDYHDTILSDPDNSNDKVCIYGDLTKADLRAVLAGSHLTISDPYGDSLTIQNWNSGQGYKLDQFYFSSEGITYRLSMSGGAAEWTLVG